jgi:uncharacterized protein YraI
MNRQTRFFPLVVFVAMTFLSSLACRLSEVGTAVPTIAPPTLPPFVTYTPMPAPVEISLNLPTTEPIGSATAVTSPVMTARVDLNVRRGPGTQYPILTAFHAGDEAVIVGRSPDGYWWKIVCPSPYGGECWSSARGEYSTAVNTQTIPVAPVPPLPTDTPTATATTTPTFTPSPTWTNTPTATSTWTATPISQTAPHP